MGDFNSVGVTPCSKLSTWREGVTAAGGFFVALLEVVLVLPLEEDDTGLSLAFFSAGSGLPKYVLQ